MLVQLTHSEIVTILDYGSHKYDRYKLLIIYLSSDVPVYNIHNAQISQEQYRNTLVTTCKRVSIAESSHGVSWFKRADPVKLASQIIV